MSLADFASAHGLMWPKARTAAPADKPAGQKTAGACPFHQGGGSFNEWLEEGLYCMAGKREFRLGRYHVTRFRSGAEYAKGLADFRRMVSNHEKTGYLALFMTDERCPTVEDELNLLGAAMYDAGLTDDLEALIGGRTLAHAIEVPCPVTGVPTNYEFFSVAFCRNANNLEDPLYDPSLSAPFTAINTTSDAFAFARLVADQAMRAWGRPVHEMTHDRDAVERLFRRCVTAWQNMSITTITNYSRVAEDRSRGVHLSDDRTHWFAAHNDPVFAELKKCPHQHEMPVTYAARLTAKWSANLFDGKPYEPGRDGQSGGVAVSDELFEVEGLPRELFQF
jgi:hypothetical protein